MQYAQCFICREWSWDVCGSIRGTGGLVQGVQLCLPCYVDVLEVKQARGVKGEELSAGLRGCAPLGRAEPGNSPSPSRQMDLFPQTELFD